LPEKKNGPTRGDGWGNGKGKTVIQTETDFGKEKKRTKKRLKPRPAIGAFKNPGPSVRGDFHRDKKAGKNEGL